MTVSARAYSLSAAILWQLSDRSACDCPQVGSSGHRTMLMVHGSRGSSCVRHSRMRVQGNGVAKERTVERGCGYLFKAPMAS